MGLNRDTANFVTYWKPGDWINLTLQNGWTTDNGNASRARVRRVGPFVQIDAVIQHAAGATTLDPFVLPVGYRPPSFVNIPGTDFTAASFRALVAAPSGAATTNGASILNIALFGVVFYVG